MDADCTFAERIERLQNSESPDGETPTRHLQVSPIQDVRLSSFELSMARSNSNICPRNLLQGNAQSIERLNDQVKFCAINNHPDELSSKMGTASKAMMVDYDKYFEGDSMIKPSARKNLISQSLDRQQYMKQMLDATKISRFQTRVQDPSAPEPRHFVTFSKGNQNLQYSGKDGHRDMFESTEATGSMKKVPFASSTPNQEFLKSQPRLATGRTEAQDFKSKLKVRNFDPSEAAPGGRQPAVSGGQPCSNTAVLVDSVLAEGAGVSKALTTPNKAGPSERGGWGHSWMGSPGPAPAALPELFPSKSTRLPPLPSPKTPLVITFSQIGPLLEGEEFLAAICDVLGVEELDWGWGNGLTHYSTEERYRRLWKAFQKIRESVQQLTNMQTMA